MFHHNHNRPRRICQLLESIENHFNCIINTNSIIITWISIILSLNEINFLRIISTWSLTLNHSSSWEQEFNWKLSSFRCCIRQIHGNLHVEQLTLDWQDDFILAQTKNLSILWLKTESDSTRWIDDLWQGWLLKLNDLNDAKAWTMKIWELN